MPVKKAKEPEVQLDDEVQVELDESNRLQTACYDLGIVAKTRRMDTTQSDLKLPAKLDGKDIVKRGNARKNRYLLNIPAQLSALSAGKLGSLARLDTRNPVMYIDFAEGRLKFKGTLFFPKNKYMTLRLAPKEVRCEDIFESLIVFSEYCWIGTEEENPEEHPLPMPSTLAIAREEDKSMPESEPAIEMTQAEPTQATQGATQDESATQTQPAVRSSQQAKKRARYTELSSGDDDSGDLDVNHVGEADDEGEESLPAKRPKKGATTASKGSGRKPKAATHPIIAIDLSDNSDADADIHKLSDSETGSRKQASSEDGSQSQRSLPKTNARPKKSLATLFEDSAEEAEDPGEDDSDFG